MKHLKITCDGCGKDLTTTTNCMDWMIKVAPKPIPSRGPMVTLMHMGPPLDRSYHFCSLSCFNGHDFT